MSEEKSPAYRRGNALSRSSPKGFASHSHDGKLVWHFDTLSAILQLRETLA